MPEHTGDNDAAEGLSSVSGGSVVIADCCFAAARGDEFRPPRVRPGAHRGTGGTDLSAGPHARDVGRRLGKKSDNPQNPDYVPSLFEFLSPEQRQQKIQSYLEFQQTQTDSDSDGIQENEDRIQILGCDENGVDEENAEESTVETLPMKAKADEFSSTQEAVKDDNDDTAKRKLEVEADDSEDIDSSVEIDEEKESMTKKRRMSRNFDTSALGDLTQKITAIIGCPNKVFDLKEVAQKLGVPRRRLYDITNVLKGIRLIEKSSKNNMRWLGPGVNQSLKTELQVLVEQERELDELIEDCRLQLHRLCEESYSHGLAYVTYEDLRGIPTLRDQAVIVIKAPVKTKLEVSHPRESFQIYLCSSQGPIDVLMCHDDPQEAPV